jgi:quercetin dioxygenase-like cupin family protein
VTVGEIFLRYDQLTQEGVMRIGTVGIMLLGASTFAAAVASQTAPSPPAITRTVIAATKLPTVVAAPLYFKAVSITLPPGESSNFSGANGIVYQMSGSTEVLVGDGVKIVRADEGLFVASGERASLKAGGKEPATMLHFLLAPASELNQPVETAPAIVKEIYRSAAPIPELRSGGYDLNLTRVTFPANMPSNAPHHRSGAALYYILSGTGANTIEGKTESRGPGSLIYEPFGLVHQWGNPGDTPLTFLAFNINPEGVAAVVPGAPAKPQ